MPSLENIVAQGRAVGAHRPWPRVAVTPELWAAATDELVGERATLLGLWGSESGYAVHMALIGDGSPDIAVLSLACPVLEFPSVGRRHAPAIRL